MLLLDALSPVGPLIITGLGYLFGSLLMLNYLFYYLYTMHLPWLSVTAGAALLTVLVVSWFGWPHWSVLSWALPHAAVGLGAVLELVRRRSRMGP